ncbi:MAG: Hpt domain-containing protein [Magnetovibrionaceae bacterium]
MSNEPKAEIIRPPNALKNKVREGGPGAVDVETLKKAEQVIENLSGDYLQWADEDLKRLGAAFLELKAQPDSAEKLDRVFQISHDMKGQGGSFGYDLITIIGNSLCRFIEGLGDAKPKPEQIDVIAVHMQTMKVVISQRMQGNGGVEGTKVLKGLEMVVTKVTKKG